MSRLTQVIENHAEAKFWAEKASEYMNCSQEELEEKGYGLGNVYALIANAMALNVQNELRLME